MFRLLLIRPTVTWTLGTPFIFWLVLWLNWTTIHISHNARSCGTSGTRRTRATLIIIWFVFRFLHPLAVDISNGTCRVPRGTRGFRLVVLVLRFLHWPAINIPDGARARGSRRSCGTAIIVPSRGVVASSVPLWLFWLLGLTDAGDVASGKLRRACYVPSGLCGELCVVARLVWLFLSGSIKHQFCVAAGLPRLTRLVNADNVRLVDDAPDLDDTCAVHHCARRLLDRNDSTVYDLFERNATTSIQEAAVRVEGALFQRLFKI